MLGQWRWQSPVPVEMRKKKKKVEHLSEWRRRGSSGRVETAPVYMVPSRACRGGAGVLVDVTEVGGNTDEVVMSGNGVVLGRGRVSAVEVAAAAALWRSR